MIVTACLIKKAWIFMQPSWWKCGKARWTRQNIRTFISDPSSWPQLFTLQSFLQNSSLITFPLLRTTSTNHEHQISGKHSFIHSLLHSFVHHFFGFLVVGFSLNFLRHSAFPLKQHFREKEGRAVLQFGHWISFIWGFFLVSPTRHNK